MLDKFPDSPKLIDSKFHLYTLNTFDTSANGFIGRSPFSCCRTRSTPVIFFSASAWALHYSFAATRGTRGVRRKRLPPPTVSLGQLQQASAPCAASPVISGICSLFHTVQAQRMQPRHFSGLAASLDVISASETDTHCGHGAAALDSRIACICLHVSIWVQLGLADGVTRRRMSACHLSIVAASTSSRCQTVSVAFLTPVGWLRVRREEFAQSRDLI